MSSGFHDIRFPLALSHGASGGPARRTEIVALGSGHEDRNARWAASRRRFDAGTGLRSLDDIHALIGFFEERQGRLHGFRFRDFTDWKSCPPAAEPAADDQAIGTGDGATAAFQLVKTYGGGFAPLVREIEKPVAGTVRVAVGGVEQETGDDFTVDAATGLVTFSPGAVPADGLSVTAGYEFDVPVRFDSDELVVSLAAFHAGEVPAIPLVEIRT